MKVRFCSSCGQRLGDSCDVCPSCGQSAENAVSVQDNPYDADKYRKNYSVRYVSTRPRVTIVLILINVVIWALINICSMFDVSLASLLFMHGGAVCAGEVYRLITAMFTHQSMWHLASNCYALYIYGSITETILGKGKFLLVYLTSGLVGNVLSFALIDGASLGASGAVFGLLGAVIALYFISPLTISKAMLSNVIFCTVLTTLYSLGGGVNNVAHFGGMAGGYLIACVVVKSPFRKKWFTNKTLCGILTGVILVGGVAYGFVRPENTGTKNYAKYYRFIAAYDFGLDGAANSIADKLITSDEFLLDAYAVKAIYAYRKGDDAAAEKALYTLIGKNLEGNRITLTPENVAIYKELAAHAKKAGEENEWLNSLSAAVE